VRRCLLLALPLAALAVAAASAPAGAAPAKSCRIDHVKANNKVVFGHFATFAAAKAIKKHAEKYGFKGITIVNDGCGDFEASIGGANTSAQRQSFAAEAAKVGFWITFQQTAPVLQKNPGYTYGVFGTFPTITAANALSWRLAKVNFRYIDIAYVNGRWQVVMPAVPFKAALSIAAEVHKAGFHIAFQPE
jgi:hypothetical protein